MITNYTEERCYKVNVTPELAQEWLARNKCNRTISEGYVNSLIKDMREGKWVINGNTICFSKEGELLDGQHRLTAIAKSGIPQDVYVMTGLNKTSHFDDGRKRSIRDQILAMGKADKNDPFASNHCIATARYIHGLNMVGDGYHHGIVKPSTEEVFYWMVKHEEAINEVYAISKAHAGTVNARPAYLLSAVLAAFEAGIPADRIEAWHRSVRLGEYSNEKQYSAIALRNLIISTSRTGKYASQRELFFKAEYSLFNYDVRSIKFLKEKECFPLPKWDV